MTLDNKTEDLFKAPRRPNDRMPPPPHLRSIVSISTAMAASAFFSLLQRNFVTLVLDIRSKNELRQRNFANGSDIGYVVRQHPGMEYFLLTSLVPTRQMYKKLRKALAPNKREWADPKAWTEFLQAYGRLIEERKPFTPGFWKSLYGNHTGVAIICNCERHEDCHRSYLCGYLKERLPGVELKVLYPGQTPKRKQPERRLTVSIPRAGLIAEP